MLNYFINADRTLWVLSIIFTVIIITISVKMMKKKYPSLLTELKEPPLPIMLGLFIFVISLVISVGIHYIYFYQFVKNTDQIITENYIITRSDKTLDFTKLGSDPNTELYYKENYKTPYDKNVISYLQPLKENHQFNILSESERNIRIKSTYDKDQYDINLKTHPELFKMIKNLKK